jgi:glycerol-3-phosphate dehydrogenase (NAD(P)+)
MSSVAVIGAGAWGTALALQAERAGNRVALVTRDATSASTMKARKESHRLPGYLFPEQLDVRDDIPGDVDLLLWVVPSQYLRSSLLRLRPALSPIVVCAKGFEADTHLLPLEVVIDVLPGRPLAALTGPNFALEVAAGLPTATVVASDDSGFREQVRITLATSTFRIYGNDDPIGSQLGGAGKNVIAIAAGAVIGAGLGENARAALVTRGLSELRRLTVALGGRAETMMGLSGLGDLLLTCTGTSSRNFSLGYALGQGEHLSNVLASRSGVIEGIPTAAALVARAGEVDLPICRAVAELLTGTKTLDQTIAELLSRPQRDE